MPARVEPHQLCEDDALRPDIQLDLPDYTLLGDVTVNHPNALSWRKKAAKRGVAAVGDERAEQKDDKYAAMAKVVDAEFSAFVLYTYGGFHSSALSFIDKLAAGCDRAVALVPLADWKDDLKDRIAVCVQRHTADIVIDDARRARMASIPVRGRAAGGPSGRPRPSALAASSRRQREAVERLCAEGGRAASLCAGLLVSLSPSSGPSEDVSPMSVDSDAPREVGVARAFGVLRAGDGDDGSVEAASCVPGTRCRLGQVREVLSAAITQLIVILALANGSAAATMTTMATTREEEQRKDEGQGGEEEREGSGRCQIAPHEAPFTEESEGRADRPSGWAARTVGGSAAAMVLEEEQSTLERTLRCVLCTVHCPLGYSPAGLHCSVVTCADIEESAAHRPPSSIHDLLSSVHVPVYTESSDSAHVWANMHSGILRLARYV